MKIVVISDTHSYSLKELPEQIIDACKKSDLIVHCGDYTTKQLLDELKKLKEFKGVSGNMDSDEIRKELSEKLVFNINRIKIGIIHGWGAPFGLEDRVKNVFDEKVDLILYGHSHFPHYTLKEGINFLNPGTATGSFPSLGKSYGLVTIDKEIKCEIVKL